jgi:hypothetical protein
MLPAPPFPVAVWLTRRGGDQPPPLAPTNHHQAHRHGYWQGTTHHYTEGDVTSSPTGSIGSSENVLRGDISNKLGEDVTREGRKLHVGDTRNVYKLTRECRFGARDYERERAVPPETMAIGDFL